MCHMTQLHTVCVLHMSYVCVTITEQSESIPDDNYSMSHVNYSIPRDNYSMSHDNYSISHDNNSMSHDNHMIASLSHDMRTHL